MWRLLTALMFLASGWVGAQNNIVGYEHWLDELDANGQRTFVPASGATINLSGINIPVDQLSLGLHRIHFRILDDNEAWSSVLRRSFYISSGESVALTAGEYWFDLNDQTRSAFTFTPAQNIDLTIAPVTSGLGLGIHRIHFRIRDDQGQWSAVLSRVVNIQSDAEVRLTLLRYWSDNGTSYPDDMTFMAIDPEVFVWDVVDEISFCAWEQTGENVYFQIKDNQDQWSSVLQRAIDVDYVSTAPDLPDPIGGLTSPPFGSTQTYTVVNDPLAGVYHWTLPDGWTGESTADTITVVVGNSNNGSELCVSAANGCGESVARCLDISTAVSSTTASNGISVYPNPFTEGITVSNKDGKPVRVVLYDPQGRLLHDKVLNRETYIDLQGLANGTYTAFFWKELERIHRVTLIKQ